MSEWAPKVFWKEVSVAQGDSGHSVLLDGRAIRTPAKSLFVVPTAALANAIADEWRAQTDHVDPTTMPLTRMANAAIDKLGSQRGAVCDMLAAYGETDLLCYRAESPRELVNRQAAGWDPLLDWSARQLNAPLAVQTGIMPKDQSADALAALSAHVHGVGEFELSALHDFIVISGSLVLGLAVLHGEIGPEQAFNLSRIDESFQQELWGVDEEASALDAYKRDEFLTAYRFFTLVKMA